MFGAIFALMVGQQEGLLACKKVSTGILMMVIQLELCTSPFQLSLMPLPSSLVAVKPILESKVHYCISLPRLSDRYWPLNECCLFVVWGRYKLHNP